MVTSPELEEFEALCERVLLIRAGRLIGEVRGTEVTKDAILSRLLSARDETTNELASHPGV
jgi:ABC-type sugar transport system ATPase subunit